MDLMAPADLYSFTKKERMKMNPFESKKSFFATCVALSAMSVAALGESEDWRLRTQRYSTGAVAYVPKNIACIEVQLSAVCQASPSAAKEELVNLINNVTKIAKGADASISADTKKSEMSISPSARFFISQQANNPLQNVVVDQCANYAMEKGPLSQKVYSASTMIKFQIADKAAIISAVRQKVGKYAEQINESKLPLNVQSSVEKFSVDPSILESSKKELDEQSRLSKQKSRMALDEKVYGGFTEKYVVAVEENGSPEYQRIRPALDAEGNSVLEARYTFRVDYAPQNSGTGPTTKAPARGQLEKVVTGKHVVPTDYYKTTLTLSTTCHATADSARAALAPVYEEIKAKAEAVTKAGPAGYQNRVTVKSVSNPFVDRSIYRPWTYALRENKSDKYVTSYLNVCDGTEVKGTDASNLPENFVFSQSLNISATSFAGLIELQGVIAKANEKAGTAANAVVAHLAPLTPKLDDVKHHAAVEVSAYANALEKLLSPKGELASVLLDELNASEAYYEFIGYSDQADMYGGAMMQSAAPSAPGSPMKSANESADMSVSEDNIALERVASFKVSTVQFRAKRNLIDALKQARIPRTVLDPSLRLK